ncbi:MAG TPA: hypothetical protein VIJ70_04610, partial [Gaiellaceae bacterium]
MKRRTSLLALLAAGAVTVLSVAGLSSAASDAAPTNQSLPAISGTADEGSTLTASSGSWNGTAPIKYSFQWRRCDKNGTGCANVGGADTSTYLIRHADVDNTLRVRVTAKNGDGSAQATSAQTAVVQAKTAPPPTTVNGCPATGSGPLAVTSVSLPARLVVDGQQLSPSPIGRSTTDLTIKFHVSACNGRSITGALVYVTAIPFQQFSIPAETATGSDGWATMTMHRGN